MFRDSENESHETKESINKGKHGSDYELEVAKFLLKRTIDNDFEDFKFTREKTGLGKFDDLTLVYTNEGKKRIRLIQVKHIQDKEKKITYAQLTSDESYFLLPKYFNHYVESLPFIKSDKDFKDAQLQDLIICTNIGFEGDIKGIVLKQVDNDEIFQNGFKFFKLEIPMDEMRKIFQKSYLSPMERLAHELLLYILSNQQINIATLVKDEAISLIKHYHLSLANCVIDVERCQFSEQFLRSDDPINDNAIIFRNTLFKSAADIFASLNGLSDKELQNKLNIKNIENAKKIKCSLSSFESVDKLEKLLKIYKFKLAGNFGKNLTNWDQTYTELPNSISSNANAAVDAEIKSFLDKLVFAIEQFDIEMTVRKELGDDLYCDYHKRMHEWYHKGCVVSKENGQFIKSRKWIAKETLLNEAQKIAVHFQGRNMILKDFVGENKNFIDPQTLLNVFCLKELNIGGELPNLEEVKNYYIKRTLMRQVKIRKEVFKENKKDIFVISNVQDNYSKLRSWIPDDEMLYFPYYSIVSSRFIYTRKQFERDQFSALSVTLYNLHELKALDGKVVIPPIHLFEMIEDEFIWKQSYGSLSAIRAYVHEDNEKGIQLFKENEITGTAADVIVVSAKPGMGKTTLFYHVAQQLTHHETFGWVITVDLKHSIHHVDEANFDNAGLSTMVEFLSKVATFQESFSEIILKLHIENNGNIFILIDGFDELESYDQQRKIVTFLKFMKENVETCAIWVNTRPHLKEYLENNLSTFAFSLKEISEDEQIYFLTKFWKIDLLDETDEIEKYAQQLITKFRESINDHEQSFLGIPLMTKLLSVAFQKEAVSKRLSIPAYIDLNYLYETFIETKYDIFFLKYCEKLAEDTVGGSKVEQFRNSAIKSLNKAHGDFALTSGILFPSEETKYMIKNNVTFSLEQLLEIGIVFKSRDQHQFIHRTFSEYFAAKRLADLTRKKLSDPSKYATAVHFLENYILEGKHYSMLYFFDHLVPDKSSLHRSILKGHAERELIAATTNINEHDTIGRTPLYYALMYKINVVRFLLEEKQAQVDICNVFLRHSIELFFANLMKENRDYEKMVKILLERSDTGHLSEKARNQFLSEDSLMVAVMYEKWDVVRIMALKGIGVKHIENDSDMPMIPLIVALELGAPLDIIKSLISITDIKLLSRRMLSDSPGIHCMFVRLLDQFEEAQVCDILKVLKEKGADLNVRDERGLTLLHVILGRNSSVLSSFFADPKFEVKKMLILKSLLENGAIYNLNNNDGKTPYELYTHYKKIRYLAFIRDAKPYSSIANTYPSWHKPAFDDASSMVQYPERTERLFGVSNDEFDMLVTENFVTQSEIENLLTLVQNLFVSVQNNNKNLVRSYLKEAHRHGWVKAVTNVRNKDDQTLVCVAEQMQLSKIARILRNPDHLDVREMKHECLLI